nr:hypothetical protein [Tanacetum cinerariifolium]
MDTTTHHATAILEITSSFTTPTPPPPLFFNPLSQQATPTLTPITYEPSTSFPVLPNFSSVFKFNERVTSLEKDLLEMKQVDQYAKSLSLIPSIVDRYMDNKLGEAINNAIQAHIFYCREEAQAGKMEYVELVTKELYNDVNVNLGNKDTEMTNADQGALEQQNASQQSGFEQEKEDAHVTLTHVVDKQKTRGPTQSSSVSSF